MTINYNLFILLFAICYAVSFLILTVLLKNTKYNSILKYISIVYKGFDYSHVKGVIKGVVWAFVDGIITGTIVAFILKLILK